MKSIIIQTIDSFRKGKSIFLILFAFVLLCLSGCDQKPNQTPGTSAPRQYRIGLGPWVGFGPLYLARDKGFFEEEGIKVELIVLTGVAERNSALKAGRIDALAAPVDYFVLAAGNNLPATIVMAIDESTGGDGIVAKKSVQTIEDLSGKRVAVQRGLPGEFFLRALLQQKGVNFNELKTEDMETAQAGAAFLADKVDAAVVWEPWLSKAREEGGGHVLASTKEFPNLIVDCLAFNQDVLKRSPADVVKIVKAIFKAIEFWKANAEEANKIMAPYFQVDAKKYAMILSGATFSDLARNREYFGSPQLPGPIFDVARRASGVWLDAKVIGTPVKPSVVISTEILNKRKLE
ncbi:MAG: ABC transporter substrate-binding protein [bacterium]|nr:ABC transporter substrate-binding protein [bacterium]